MTSCLGFWPNRSNSLVPLILLANSLLLTNTGYAREDKTLIDTALLSKLEGSVLAEHGFEDEFDAQVWFKSMLPRMNRFKLSVTEKLQILQWVHREAHISQLDPGLVLAVIEVESRFDRYAISRAGA